MQQKPGITSFFHKTTCPVKQRSMPCKTTIKVLTNPRNAIGRPRALCAARVKGPPLELSTRRGRLSHVLLQCTLMQCASTFPQTCDNLLLCFHELAHPAGLGRGWCIMPCLPSVLGGGSGPNFSKWMTTPLWTFCTSDSNAPLIIFWLYTAYERPDREHHVFIFWLYAAYEWPDQRTSCCFYILAVHHIRVTRSEHNLRSHIHTCAHKSTHTHLYSHTPMLTYTCTHTHVHSCVLTYTHTNISKHLWAYLLWPHTWHQWGCSQQMGCTGSWWHQAEHCQEDAEPGQRCADPTGTVLWSVLCPEPQCSWASSAEDTVKDVQFYLSDAPVTLK